MDVRDLIPWNRNQVPAPRPDDPFLALHREMNRLFDDFWRGFDGGLSNFGRAGAWPKIEVSDGNNALTVTAEIPGLSEKDVEVLITGDALTLRGERRSETEDKDRQFSERYYGRFERRIPLAEGIDRDKVTATFKNGILTIALPKTPEAAESVKRIPIGGAG
jgi:HSP20 family protein